MLSEVQRRSYCYRQIIYTFGLVEVFNHSVEFIFKDFFGGVFCLCSWTGQLKSKRGDEMQQMDVVRNQTSAHRARSLPGELPVVSYVIIYVHATDTGHHIIMQNFLGTFSTMPLCLRVELQGNLPPASPSSW